MHLIKLSLTTSTQSDALKVFRSVFPLLAYSVRRCSEGKFIAFVNLFISHCNRHFREEYLCLKCICSVQRISKLKYKYCKAQFSCSLTKQVLRLILLFYFLTHFCGFGSIVIVTVVMTFQTNRNEANVNN